MDQVGEVKAKTDIVALISEYLPLKRAGRHWRANCPFHEEKSPSFMVSPELQIFKCFGCGKSGDCISFLMERENMEFYEALKLLADKAGVKLTPRNPKEESVKEIIGRINEIIKNYYHYVLLKHPQGSKALKYLLEERGLKKDALDKFEIGFAPKVSRSIVTTLTGKFKFTPKDLIATGTMYPRGNELIDRFAGRVIFPLMDHRGKTIGFAGRLLPWEDNGTSGKYINSPETPLYHKSANLYGLNFTREEIKHKKFAVVVEGELDAISSYLAGVTNIVAIKGTAITREHAQLLKRFCDKIVFFLDSDAAGDMATKRGIVEAYKSGLQISVAQLASFKDPDEAARKNPTLLHQSIDEAKNVWDYFLETAFSKFDSKTAEGKLALSKELVPIIASIPDKILAAHYAELFAKKLGVPAASVYQELDKTTPFVEMPPEGVTPVAKKEETNLKENWLMTLALFFDHGFFADTQNGQFFTTNVTKRLFEELSKFDLTKIKFQEIREQLPAELRELFSDLVLADVADLEGKYKTEMDKKKKEIKVAIFKNEKEKIQIEIADKEPRGEDVSELKQKFADLAKKSRLVEEN